MLKQEQPLQDEFLIQAINLSIENGFASISMIQRKFVIGCFRASRLMDIMIELGVLENDFAKHERKVLISSIDDVFPKTH